MPLPSASSAAPPLTAVTVTLDVVVVSNDSVKTRLAFRVGQRQAGRGVDGGRGGRNVGDIDLGLRGGGGDVDGDRERAGGAEVGLVDLQVVELAEVRAAVRDEVEAAVEQLAALEASSSGRSG